MKNIVTSWVYFSFLFLISGVHSAVGMFDALLPQALTRKLWRLACSVIEGEMPDQIHEKVCETLYGFNFCAKKDCGTVTSMLEWQLRQAMHQGDMQKIDRIIACMDRTGPIMVADKLHSYCSRDNGFHWTLVPAVIYAAGRPIQRTGYNRHVDMDYTIERRQGCISGEVFKKLIDCGERVDLMWETTAMGTTMTPLCCAVRDGTRSCYSLNKDAWKHQIKKIIYIAAKNPKAHRKLLDNLDTIMPARNAHEYIQRVEYEYTLLSGYVRALNNHQFSNYYDRINRYTRLVYVVCEKGHFDLLQSLCGGEYRQQVCSAVSGMLNPMHASTRTSSMP